MAARDHNWRIKRTPEDIQAEEARREMLQAKVLKAGGVSKYAQVIGYHRASLARMLSGEVRVSDRVLGVI